MLVIVLPLVVIFELVCSLFAVTAQPKLCFCLCSLLGCPLFSFQEVQRWSSEPQNTCNVVRPELAKMQESGRTRKCVGRAASKRSQSQHNEPDKDSIPQTALHVRGYHRTTWFRVANTQPGTQSSHVQILSLIRPCQVPFYFCGSQVCVNITDHFICEVQEKCHALLLLI